MVDTDSGVLTSDIGSLSDEDILAEFCEEIQMEVDDGDDGNEDEQQEETPKQPTKSEVHQAIKTLSHLLWRRANARNVSFSISVRWSIYIINSVDKPNFRVSLPRRRSTIVSLEINPLYSHATVCLLLREPRFDGKQASCHSQSTKVLQVWLYLHISAHFVEWSIYMKTERSIFIQRDAVRCTCK